MTVPTTSIERDASKSATRRDPYLDNAKVILIMLVVVGHLLAVIPWSVFADTIYLWIYAFHMPAFVLVSGYLSRSYTGTPKQIAAIVSIMLVPYFVFQIILRVLPWLLHGEALHLNLFVPAWSNWYLLALAGWRLLVPLIRMVRYPFAISIGVALASVLFGGITQGLSGARILSYLPFFVAGFLLTPERLDRFKHLAATLWARTAAAALLIGVGVAFFLEHEHLRRSWFMMSGVEADLGQLGNVALRATMIAFTFVMLTAALVLVPQRRLFFTDIGSATLTVYLLQAATLMVIRPYVAAWDGWTWPMVLLLIAGGAAYALLLGSRPVQRATAWLVDPVGTFRWARRLTLRDAPR